MELGIWNQELGTAYNNLKFIYYFKVLIATPKNNCTAGDQGLHPIPDSQLLIPLFARPHFLIHPPDHIFGDIESTVFIQHIIQAGAGR